MIPALVLTAGLGTRLRPLSFVRAKGALPVAGEPLGRRILRWLGSNGVTDAVLNLHHLPHTLTSAIGDGTDLGMRVRYSWEVPVLGSAGGPKRAVPLIGRSPFLIVNGDTLTDVSLKEVIDDHARSGALVTMAVVPNNEPDKYGGIVVDEGGSVSGFVRRGSSQPSFHFIGVQVAAADAFASVPVNTPYESVGTLYPALIAGTPGAIRAFRTPAEFLDIGTPADYLSTALRIADREGRANVGLRAQIAADARVERSVLWDDVIVENGAFLKACIVTDGARVPADTSWHGVTLRVAAGELAPGERRIGDLAIASL
jgi:NDP-sugar pyrophosphorylase family protein